MKAHILKQFSAAEITESTKTEAPSERRTLEKELSAADFFMEKERKRARNKSERNWAKRMRKPIFALLKIPVPTAEMTKGGPALTQ